MPNFLLTQTSLIHFLYNLLAVVQDQEIVIICVQNLETLIIRVSAGQISFHFLPHFFQLLLTSLMARNCFLCHVLLCLVGQVLDLAFKLLKIFFTFGITKILQGLNGGPSALSRVVKGEVLVIFKKDRGVRWIGHPVADRDLELGRVCSCEILVNTH